MDVYRAIFVDVLGAPNNKVCISLYCNSGSLSLAVFARYTREQARREQGFEANAQMKDPFDDGQAIALTLAQLIEIGSAFYLFLVGGRL